MTTVTQRIFAMSKTSHRRVELYPFKRVANSQASEQLCVRWQGQSSMCKTLRDKRNAIGQMDPNPHPHRVS